MTQTIQELGEAQKRTDASLKELVESQKHTGERLNVIIDIVMEGRKPGEVQ